MEKVTVFTNHFDKSVEDEIMKNLYDGKAVRVGSTCIGHTRAWMIEQEGVSFLEMVGAHIYEQDCLGDYYCL